MSKIEERVMAGVAMVYVARRLMSRTALECYALFLSAFCLTLFVSLPHVEHNFLVVERGGLPSTATYLVSAVLNTRVAVQAVLLLGVVAVALLVWDAARSFIAPAAVAA